jgi:CubicO group peptidase (beta-lactamase class C family)
LLFLPAAIQPAAPPKLTDADLAAILEPIRKKHGVPALAAALVLSGRIVATAAVGVRKWGDATPVTVDDEFHLGSITKSMTATVVEMLVHEGKLKWDMTPLDVFPELARKIDPAFRAVTLRQFACHRSGIAQTNAWAAGSFEQQADDQVGARYRFVASLLAQKPIFPPGSKYEYSNNGYILLGAVAEKVTGRPWEQLIRTMIFKPLGMRTGGFGPMGTPGKIDQPWQHVPQDGKPQPRENVPADDNPPVLNPAGRVHCSIGDLAKYVLFHLDGEAGESKVLTKDEFTLLHTAQFGGEYAFGWLVLDRGWADHRALFHNGSNNMNFAAVWMAPSCRFGAMAACNMGGEEASNACDDAVAALVEKGLGR